MRLGHCIAAVFDDDRAIVEALKDPEVVKRLATDGSTPVGSSPEQFNAHIRSEIAKWKKLVKEANLQLHQ